MADDEPAGSVIIPAWNESASITTTLQALLDPADVLRFETIVACNGCTDDTAERARRSGVPVVVLELPAIGKTGAIREAEAVATRLPRLYLDADVTLSGSAAHRVLDALRDGAVAARPPVHFDTTGASPTVRRFYRQRSRLPGVMADLCGAGVYGLSASARARFESFPDVVADDLFAARIVNASEVRIVECEPVRITVPRDVRSLVRTLARVNRGNRQLRALMPDQVSPTARSTLVQLARSITRPQDVVDATAYASVVIAARIASRRASSAWTRDETSRRAGAGDEP